MIAFLLTVYAAVMLALFKLKLVKPRPYPIAIAILAGILMIGGVMVAWMRYAPISANLVTSQYVVQLVPYNVKGYVKKVYAKANEPLKKGELLLEIDPAPYQYAVNQVDAQLNAAKATVTQSRASLEAADANAAKARDAAKQAQAAVDQAKGALDNAQAALAKWRAADELAKTEETLAINLQRTGVGAISFLKVEQARQKRQEEDAAVLQAEAGVLHARAAEQQAIATLASAQSGVLQAAATAKQAASTLQIDSGYLHQKRYAGAHHLESDAPDEEVAFVCFALSTKVLVP